MKEYDENTYINWISAAVRTRDSCTRSFISRNHYAIPELTTAACVAAGATVWAAASFFVQATNAKQRAHAYKNEVVIFNMLKSKCSKKMHALKTDFAADAHIVERKQELEYLLTDLKNNFKRTNFIFNRLVLEHSLFDTETQQKASSEFSTDVWWNGRHQHDHKLPHTLCGEFGGYFEEYARSNSLFSIYIIEQPAFLFTRLYRTLYPNTTAITEQKEKALALALKFKELLIAQTAVIKSIDEEIQKIKQSPAYLHALEQLPWWKRIV